VSTEAGSSKYSTMPMHSQEGKGREASCAVILKNHRETSVWLLLVIPIMHSF